MRTELQIIEGVRTTFTAKVGRFGERFNRFAHGFETTICLIDVRIGQDLVTDHVWLKVGKWVEKADLTEGDTIQFDARVGEYWKGYYHDQQDFKLNMPTQVTVTHRAPRIISTYQPVIEKPDAQPDRIDYARRLIDSLTSAPKRAILGRHLDHIGQSPRGNVHTIEKLIAMAERP